MASSSRLSDLSSTGPSSSTVPGPGAIAGKFLKAVGEASLELLESVIIHVRLWSIERTLERNPRVLRNPSGHKEWQRLNAVYTDLHELCRESRSRYYSLSTQRTAARLVQEITLVTRPAPECFIRASPTNGKWEALLARVERRKELLTPLQDHAIVCSRQDLVSSYLVGGLFPAQFLPPSPLEQQAAGIRPSFNSSRTEWPLFPSDGNDNNIEAQSEVKHPIFVEDRRKRRTSVSHMFELRRLELSERAPSRSSDPTRKVLVLGEEGVGKSTLVAQFRFAINGFSSRDAVERREIIVENVMELMRNVLIDLDPLDLSEEARSSFRYVMDTFHTSVPSPLLGDAMGILSREPAVRRIVRRARFGMLSELGLESADYFFDSANRIFASDYVPTHEDVVRSLARTTGMYGYTCKVQSSPWLLIDTGGERSERRKWIHCFNNVTAVIFVVALSDYNKTVNKDRHRNRMQESLQLFGSVANTRLFANSLIVLLFNKFDEFVETLEVSPLKDYFSDYTGDDIYDACEYFERRFLSLIEDKKRPIMGSYTTAVNTEATHAILHSIQDEINRYYYEHNL